MCPATLVAHARCIGASSLKWNKTFPIVISIEFEFNTAKANWCLMLFMNRAASAPNTASVAYQPAPETGIDL